MRIFADPFYSRYEIARSVEAASWFAHVGGAFELINEILVFIVGIYVFSRNHRKKGSIANDYHGHRVNQDTEEI